MNQPWSLYTLTTLAIAVLPRLFTLRHERATTLRMGAPKPTNTVGYMNGPKISYEQTFPNKLKLKLAFPKEHISTILNPTKIT